MASQSSQNRRSLRTYPPLPIVHEHLVADTDTDAAAAAATTAEASIPRVQSPAHLAPPKRHHVRVVDGPSSGSSRSKGAGGDARRSSTGGRTRAPRNTGQLYSHQQAKGPRIAFQYSRPWIAYSGSGDPTGGDLEKQQTRESDASGQGWVARRGGRTRVLLVILVLVIIAAALAVGLGVGLRRS